MFDGRLFIENDPRIRSLFQWEFLRHTSRPFTRFTFALNYAHGKLDVFGYHAVNLAIHVCAALALFGLIRRTFRFSPRLAAIRGRLSDGTAMAAAFLWMLHPLQTESVTYIFQRAESMMSLFYLLTLYALSRALEKHESRKRWMTASCLACLLGMGCKPVMVTAPVMALVYDRIFWADSWRAVRRRAPFYAALAATWIPLTVIGFSAHESRSTIVGSAHSLSPLAYAFSQTAVILHYLRLSVWPSDLVLDYIWPPGEWGAKMLISTAAVAGLLAGTVRLLRRSPPAAFPALWFFIVLAPTSSFFPIADIAEEHRMYLPLAGLVLPAVLAGAYAIERFASSPKSAAVLKIAVWAGVAALLCTQTVERNGDYRSRYAMWTDVVEKRPGNLRAYLNLGAALSRRDRNEQAASVLRTALKIESDEYARSFVDKGQLHFNLAVALEKQRQIDAAIRHYRAALVENPRLARARSNLGILLARRESLESGIREFREAIEILPDSAMLHANLGGFLAMAGEADEAAGHYQTALRLKPDSAQTLYNYAVLLIKLGRGEEAMGYLDAAMRPAAGDPSLMREIRRAQSAARGLRKKVRSFDGSGPPVSFAASPARYQYKDGQEGPTPMVATTTQAF